MWCLDECQAWGTWLHQGHVGMTWCQFLVMWVWWGACWWAQGCWWAKHWISGIAQGFPWCTFVVIGLSTLSCSLMWCAYLRSRLAPRDPSFGSVFSARLCLIRWPQGPCRPWWSCWCRERWLKPCHPGSRQRWCGQIWCRCSPLSQAWLRCCCIICGLPVWCHRQPWWAWAPCHWDVETEGRFHEDLLLKFPIEVCGLDIHLMYLEIMFCGDGEDGSQGWEFSNGCKSFIVIYTFNLCKALHNYMGLVLLYLSIWSPFDTEYPFASNNLSPFWAWYNFVYAHCVKWLLFIVIYEFPFSSIRAYHSFHIGSWVFDYVSTGYASMCSGVWFWAIGADRVTRVIILYRCVDIAFQAWGDGGRYWRMW